MSRILPEIREMSENTTTASAFPGYLLVVHLYGYPIPMKLNKGGVGGLLLIFSPPQSIPSLVGIRPRKLTSY